MIVNHFNNVGADETLQWVLKAHISAPCKRNAKLSGFINNSINSAADTVSYRYKTVKKDFYPLKMSL